MSTTSVFFYIKIFELLTKCEGWVDNGQVLFSAYLLIQTKSRSSIKTLTNAQTSLVNKVFTS